MTKNKKYSYKIEQDGSGWKALITRQVTSKKTIISKQQNAFANEAEAKQWAERQLVDFATTLGESNQRHGQQRKLDAEERRQRSARRAEKTQQAKQAKIKPEQELTNTTEGDSDTSSESD